MYIYTAETGVFWPKNLWWGTRVKICLYCHLWALTKKNL